MLVLGKSASCSTFTCFELTSCWALGGSIFASRSLCYQEPPSSQRLLYNQMAGAWVFIGRIVLGREEPKSRSRGGGEWSEWGNRRWVVSGRRVNKASSEERGVSKQCASGFFSFTLYFSLFRREDGCNSKEAEWCNEELARIRLHPFPSAPVRTW